MTTPDALRDLRGRVASTEPVRVATKPPTPPSLPRLPVEDYQSQAPDSIPFARTGSGRQSSRDMRSADDDWSDSDDDDDDFALQSNVLTKPNRKVEGQVNPFTCKEKRHKTPSQETLPGVKPKMLKFFNILQDDRDPLTWFQICTRFDRQTGKWGSTLLTQFARCHIFEIPCILPAEKLHHDGLVELESRLSIIHSYA